MFHLQWAETTPSLEKVRKCPKTRRVSRKTTVRRTFSGESYTRNLFRPYQAVKQKFLMAPIFCPGEPGTIYNIYTSRKCESRIFQTEVAPNQPSKINGKYVPKFNKLVTNLI